MDSRKFISALAEEWENCPLEIIEHEILPFWETKFFTKGGCYCEFKAENINDFIASLGSPLGRPILEEDIGNGHFIVKEQNGKRHAGNEKYLFSCAHEFHWQKKNEYICVVIFDISNIKDSPNGIVADIFICEVLLNFNTGEIIIVKDDLFVAEYELSVGTKFIQKLKAKLCGDRFIGDIKDKTITFITIDELIGTYISK